MIGHPVFSFDFNGLGLFDISYKRIKTALVDPSVT